MYSFYLKCRELLLLADISGKFDYAASDNISLIAGTAF